MRLHLPGIPHTVTRADFTHCAFTQKVRKLGPMLRAQGFHVTHYGVAGADSGADVDVELMTEAEHVALLGHPYHATGTGFYGDDANQDSAVYRQFNLDLRAALAERVEPGDVILAPFGHAHAAALRGLPVLAQGAGALESGIGYYDCLLPWRVYESYAVRHGNMAKEGRHGVSLDSTRLEFTIPNYYELADWPAGAGGENGGGPIVFMGRLTEGKGVPIVLEVARRRPEVPFLLAGQGDPLAWGPLPPNVEYVGSLTTERAAFLGAARAIIAPSRFAEPFCGSVVEAALCGTPAITSDFGAFAETVEHGITGLRCQTLTQFCAAVDDVTALDRPTVRGIARRRYGVETVGRQYAEALAVVAERLAAGGFPATGW